MDRRDWTGAFSSDGGKTYEAWFRHDFIAGGFPSREAALAVVTIARDKYNKLIRPETMIKGDFVVTREGRIGRLHTIQRSLAGPHDRFHLVLLDTPDGDLQRICEVKLRFATEDEIDERGWA